MQGWPLPISSNTRMKTHNFSQALLALALLCCSVQQGQAQSLLQMAFQLDTLYDDLSDTTNSTAGEFFQVLKGLYGQGQEVELDAYSISKDFGDNNYLSDEVRLAFNRLNLDQDGRAEEVMELEEQKAAIFRDALQQAKRTCGFAASRAENEGKARCVIEAEVAQFEAQPSLSLLQKIRDKTQDEKLRDNLRGLEFDVIRVDQRINELNANTEETILRLSAGANGALSFNTNTANLQTMAPIIVQAEGGGSFQSNLLDGASKWIAERMREELSIAFFDRFKRWVGGQNIYTLFPNTFNALGSSAMTDYSLMIEILKTAFEEDLQNLPFSMTSYLRAELNESQMVDQTNNEVAAAFTAVQNRLIRQEAAQRDLGTVREQMTEGALSSSQLQMLNAKSGVFEYLADAYYPALLDSASTTYELIEQQAQRRQQVLRYVMFSISAIERLGQGQHPTQLLSFLNEKIDELFPQADNIKPALLIIDVISRSLMSTDQNNQTVWVTGDELRRLSEDGQLRKFYFGLVYQEIKQALRRRRNAIETQKDEIVANTILQGVGGRVANEYMGNILATVDGVMPQHGMSFLIDTARWDNVNLAVYVDQYYSEESNQRRSAISFALTQLQQSINTDPELNEMFSFDEWAELDLVLEEALTPLIETVRSVYETYKVPDLEVDINAIISGFNSYNPAEYPEDETPYDRYESAFEWWRGYSSIPDTNEAAFAEIYAAYVEVYEAAVERQLYFQPIEARLAELQTDTRNVFYNNVAKGDSTEIIRSYERNYPQLQSLNVRLNQLDNQQQFVDNLLLNNSYSFGNLINNFVQFADRIDQIQLQFQQLQANSEVRLGQPEFIFFLKNSLDILPQIFSIALPEDDQGTLTSILELTDRALDAYTAVLEEDYDAIVMNVVAIAGSLIDSSYDEQVQLALGNNDQSLADNLRTLQDESSQKLREVFRYGAFLAAVVESESSDDIKNAIRAIALPSGSYSIKRRSFGNISLNAYPGLTGGMELARNSTGQEWAPNFGFTAPIGLAFSWGYKTKFNRSRYEASENGIYTNMSYRNRVDRSPRFGDDQLLNGASGSIFFPLIDLGALVLFRLGNSDDPLPTDVGFQQVFSPGIMYAHGFADLPISVMGGIQISPQLRTVNDERANSFRFNLSLVVDLPMANFHTRSELRP